jgi:archaellum component FlaG (FlaF/FlaG flagellin family)
MASTPDNNLRLDLPDEGLDDGTWGGILNTLIGEFERSLTAIHTQTFAASDVTILADGSADEAARKAILVADSGGGDLSGNVNFVVPNEPKIYIVVNNTTGATFTLGIKTAAGSALIIPEGETFLVWCDGSDAFGTINSAISGTVAEATNALQLGSVVAANYAQKGVLNQWTRPQIVDAHQALSTGIIDQVPTPDELEPDANLHTTIIVAQGQLTADDIKVLNPINAPLDGQVMIFIIEQHASAVVSVIWDTAFIFPDDTAVDLTQTINKVDAFSFVYNANLARWINFGTALNLPRA